MAEWLEFEETEAPNPDKGKAPLKVALSKEFINTNFELRKLTPLFQAWCHLFGKMPPINNISKVENSETPPSLLTLGDATACFGGINRPHDNEENGDSVLVYVLEPTISIEYSASMVCLAQPVPVPENTVFTVLVRQNHPLQNEYGDVNGIVTRLEQVLCSPDNNRLPKNYESRYLERFW